MDVLRSKENGSDVTSPEEFPSDEKLSDLDSPTDGDEFEWLGKRLPCPNYRLPIFLSYSSPCTRTQFFMADGIYRFLARRSLLPRTLGVNEYDLKVPLEAVRKIMSESYGLLAIAFQKTTIQHGVTSRRYGKGRARRLVLENQSLTSPWVQIEAAMAYQWRLPILILREKGVVGDGLLELGVASSFMPEFDLSEPAASFLNGHQFRSVFTQWEVEVRSTRINHFPA